MLMRVSTPYGEYYLNTDAIAYVAPTVLNRPNRGQAKLRQVRFVGDFILDVFDTPENRRALGIACDNPPPPPVDVGGVTRKGL